MCHHCHCSLELLALACPQDQAANPRVGNSRWTLPCQSRGPAARGLGVGCRRAPARRVPGCREHRSSGVAAATLARTGGSEQIPCKPRRRLFFSRQTWVSPFQTSVRRRCRPQGRGEQPGQNPDIAAGPGLCRCRAGSGAELPPAQRFGISVPSAWRLQPGLLRQAAKLKWDPNPAPPFPRAGSGRQAFPPACGPCVPTLGETAGAQEPAPSRTPNSPRFPNPSISWKLYLCKHLLPLYLSPFFLWGGLGGEGIRGGWHFPPSPLSLQNKGMQLVRQQFLEQYGWGEKVITCLGFHCGNGCTFHWETLVSGGT